MVFLLSIGYTLLVLSLTLLLLWRVEKKGKVASPQYIGVSLMALGFLVAVVGAAALGAQRLSGQEWSVFGSTAIAIVVAGGLLGIQGRVQEKPAERRVVRYGALLTALVSLAFVIAFLLLRESTLP